MAKVIGVRFRNTGKTYFFDPKELDIHKDDYVIVETAKGIDYGTVVSAPHEVDEHLVVQPLRPVMRVATERDRMQMAANLEKEKEAFHLCQEKIIQHGLDMKLTEAEYAFDNSKILFYFTADGRIDFRELVKDLASTFHTRIELRQIGVRDEARSLGGYGICGRPLCCATYLNDFVPVSIKMAKEQNLSLNPTKISGVCGRLMCCLNNEEEVYEELNKGMPSVGDTVTADDRSEGVVTSVDILRQKVRVLVEEGDEKEMRDYEVSQLVNIRRKKGKKGGQQPAAAKQENEGEQLLELERLEQDAPQGGHPKSSGSENAHGGHGRGGQGRAQGGQNGERRENSGNQGGHGDSRKNHHDGKSGKNRDNVPRQNQNPNPNNHRNNKNRNRNRNQHHAQNHEG